MHPDAVAEDSSLEPQAGFAAGDVLGSKYRLVRELGRGGMGTVWEAVNVAIGRRVAIKVCETATATTKARLRREARVASTLSHPNVVSVFDYGETFRGDAFLVMDLVEGPSLGSWLEQHGPMSPREAIELLLPVAAAMHAAHLRGIVHRDLKPDNIVLATTDAGATLPKIVDFGIAVVPWLDTDAEEAGMIAGTPDYMAPEQLLEPLEVDLRADVWAFSVVLYETLTGHTPSASALLALEPNLGLDDSLRGLGRILERSLQREPSERWGNLDELAEALAGWLELDEARDRPALRETIAIPLVQRPPPRIAAAAPAWRTRRTWFRGLVAVTTLALAGFVGATVLRPYTRGLVPASLMRHAHLVSP